MNIHGVGSSFHISPTALVKKPTDQSKSTESPVNTEAATDEVSDEAKVLSLRSGKANPHQVAEALGVKNFGQALQALKEAGVDLNSGFVSDLVHGDEAALAQAQEALTPAPEETPADEGAALSGSEVSAPTTLQPAETEQLIIDLSETNLEPTQLSSSLLVSEDLSLVDLLLEESAEEGSAD